MVGDFLKSQAQICEFQQRFFASHHQTQQKLLNVSYNVCVLFEAQLLHLLGIEIFFGMNTLKILKKDISQLNLLILQLA